MVQKDEKPKNTANAAKNNKTLLNPVFSQDADADDNKDNTDIDRQITMESQQEALKKKNAAALEAKRRPTGVF